MFTVYAAEKACLKRNKREYYQYNTNIAIIYVSITVVDLKYLVHYTIYASDLMLRHRRINGPLERSILGNISSSMGIIIINQPNKARSRGPFAFQETVDVQASNQTDQDRENQRVHRAGVR
jgi:hypothetical protein